MPDVVSEQAKGYPSELVVPISLVGDRFPEEVGWVVPDEFSLGAPTCHPESSGLGLYQLTNIDVETVDRCPRTSAVLISNSGSRHLFFISHVATDKMNERIFEDDF